MEQNYIVKEFEIEELYVNPDNARFINSEELPDEIAAIEELVAMKKTHIDRLAGDIATYGLNPNELPIVIPSLDNEGRFLVMDGNRRITSIKLMTQYRQELNNMRIDSAQKRKLMSLQCDIKTVMCLLYEKEEDVNYLIEKLHTSKPGIAQVGWDPQAQDRHQSKKGEVSKRLAIVEMLRSSQYTSSEVKNILDEGGWLSKLKRFVNKKYMAFFGIDFDKNNNIILYIEESEVIKGIGQLAIDLNNRVADLIAQTKEVREAYLNSFPVDKKPNLEKVNGNLIIFNVETKQFIDTDIENTKIIDANKVTSHNKDYGDHTGEEEKDQGSSPSDKPDSSHSKNEPEENKSGEGSDKSFGGENEAETENQDDHKEAPFDKNTNKLKSTTERTTLIPKDENIPITNQRTLDLYKELKMVSVILYTNTVSIALRSLIEFSINCFLEKKGNKWANNEQITLFQKLDKVMNILENEIGKSQLIKDVPAIYKSIENYKASDKKSDINSITNLNIIIHNHNYHPTHIELKKIYNNYSPLLNHIWEKV